jgi:hypothetical protein
VRVWRLDCGGLVLVWCVGSRVCVLPSRPALTVSLSAPTNHLTPPITPIPPHPPQKNQKVCPLQRLGRPPLDDPLCRRWILLREPPSGAAQLHAGGAGYRGRVGGAGALGGAGGAARGGGGRVGRGGQVVVMGRGHEGGRGGLVGAAWSVTNGMTQIPLSVTVYVDHASFGLDVLQTTMFYSSVELSNGCIR